MSQRQPFNTTHWIRRVRLAWAKRSSLSHETTSMHASVPRSDRAETQASHPTAKHPPDHPPDHPPEQTSELPPKQTSEALADHPSRDSWQSVLYDTWHQTWNDWLRRLTELVFFSAIASYFLLDRWIALRVTEQPTELWRIANELTDWAKSTMWLVGSAIIALAGAAMNRWKLAMRSAYFFASIAVAGILVNIFKPIFARYRPKGWLEHDWWGLSWFDVGYVVNSMPSGHSSTAGALGGALCCLFPRLWPIWITAAIVLGATRVFNNAHWVSDVILGLYLGFMTALLLKTLWQRLGWWDPKPRALRVDEPLA